MSSYLLKVNFITNATDRTYIEILNILESEKDSITKALYMYMSIKVVWLKYLDWSSENTTEWDYSPSCEVWSKKSPYLF